MKIQRYIVGFLVLVLSVFLFTQEGRATGFHRHCQEYQIPINFPNIPDAQIFGELCMPRGATPDTVQFFVHGSTYSHHYWDFPWLPNFYSQVDAALDAGYATFNIDILGAGSSSKPPSFLITLDGTIDSFHQLVVKLRNGDIGGESFSRVVYVGHSLSSILGWLFGSRYPEDIDAFVLTGALHFTQLGWLDLIIPNIYPANLDPKFANSGLDDGYMTTVPWTRKNFFFHKSNAGPVVLALDELLKTTVPGPMMFESVEYALFPDPETAPSQGITAPTLIVLGERDLTACAEPPLGLVCNEETILAHEEQFFSPDIVLDVYVSPNTGHSLALHFSGYETGNFIQDWVEDNVETN